MILVSRIGIQTETVYSEHVNCKTEAQARIAAAQRLARIERGLPAVAKGELVG
jgi:hypothetical protein